MCCRFWLIAPCSSRSAAIVERAEQQNIKVADEHAGGASEGDVRWLGRALSAGRSSARRAGLRRGFDRHAGRGRCATSATPGRAAVGGGLRPAGGEGCRRRRTWWGRAGVVEHARRHLSASSGARRRRFVVRPADKRSFRGAARAGVARSTSVTNVVRSDGASARGRAFLRRAASACGTTARTAARHQRICTRGIS